MRRVLAVLIAATICGCGGSGHDTSEGAISTLRFTPAHDADVRVNDYQTNCTPIVISTGTGVTTSMVCTQDYIGWHWETRHHPDKWTAYAFNCDGNGDCWDFHHDVARADYCRIVPGTWFDFDHPQAHLNTEGNHLRDEPICRT
jgi:hypothetical protein